MSGWQGSGYYQARVWIFYPNGSIDQTSAPVYFGNEAEYAAAIPQFINRSMDRRAEEVQHVQDQLRAFAEQAPPVCKAEPDEKPWPDCPHQHSCHTANMCLRERLKTTIPPGSMDVPADQPESEEM